MLGQGRENAKQFLRENPALAYEIEMAIRENSDSLPAGTFINGGDAKPQATGPALND
jgi:recombination protein RecA